MREYLLKFIRLHDRDQLAVVIMKSYSPEEGIDIAYELRGSSGDNPKLILLHGLFINSDCWKEQLSAFEDHNVLLLDLRGHGRSTHPKKRFTIRDYVNDLQKLLEHVGWIEDLNIAGHSLGGMVALVYAIENPSRVKKMVIGSSFCYVSNEAVTEVMGRIKSTKIEKFAMGISKRGLIPYDEEKARFVAKLVIDYMSVDDCLRATAASAGFNICKYLKSLEIPVLVLVGEKDITTPVWASEMIHKWLPRSELVIIPGAGHLTILDHPKEFNEIVRSYLTGKN